MAKTDRQFQEEKRARELVSKAFAERFGGGGLTLEKDAKDVLGDDELVEALEELRMQHAGKSRSGMVLKAAGERLAAYRARFGPVQGSGGNGSNGATRPELQSVKAKLAQSREKLEVLKRESAELKRDTQGLLVKLMKAVDNGEFAGVTTEAELKAVLDSVTGSGEFSERFGN